MKRRITRQIQLGSVFIGGDAPVSVQSMTNTRTDDAAATLKQIKELAMSFVVLYLICLQRRPYGK